VIDAAPWLGRSPREIPAYSVGEVAHYLRAPKATIRAWAVGQGDFRAVIDIPAHDGPPLLSFVNLVEVHVLDALRRAHSVPLPRVRKALHFLKRQFEGVAHPLADIDLMTDGLDLFLNSYGALINISQDGQIALRKVLEAHLRRVDRDEAGAALRLFPFTRKRPLALVPVEAQSEPRVIVIDPRISFGRPSLVGTGIPTGVIAERYKAGESIEELAADYRRDALEIQEAIRCELQAA